jgi:predicted metal-dependent phosphoesterase TrpH
MIYSVLASDAAIDLQLHTTYSDGVWTPEQLMDYLVSEQFGLVAITDHERADTAAALQQLAAEKHLPLLAAVEMSASWRDEPTDVLCYGFDPAKNALNDVAQDVVRRQTENTREVFKNLWQKGYLSAHQQEGADEAQYFLELRRLLEAPSAQQPHELVALLKQQGHGTGDTSMGQILTEAGFSWEVTDIAEVVDAAHRSGAVCLIAHPGRGDGYTRFDVRLLDELRLEVPIDGLEVYYPAHTPEQTAMYLEYAQKYNLLISSGSDSHGPDKKPIKYPAALSRSLLERLGIQII